MRKKPTAANAPAWVLAAYAEGLLDCIKDGQSLAAIVIVSKNGRVVQGWVRDGDWIICGDDGALSAETNEDFAMMYEEAGQTSKEWQ